MKIIALLTCFNRRETTLSCLRLLARQVPCGAELGQVVVDDGSSDGTSEAIAKEFPAARILRSDGSLYWCGGMRLAWQTAAEEDPDYYLLLNDDTHLVAEALRELLLLAPNPECDVIAVAAICDPVTGNSTYGGVRRKSSVIPATGRPELCDTLNANCVLIPRAVYTKLGILNDSYTHGMGDFDYGFLASRSGIRVLQSPTYLGTCSQNGWDGTWKDKSLSRIERFRQLQSPKGLPWKEWVTYNRRNSGWMWPIPCITPFLRILLGR